MLVSTCSDFCRLSQEEENEMKQLLDVLEAGCLLPQQSDGGEGIASSPSGHGSARL